MNRLNHLTECFLSRHRSDVLPESHVLAACCALHAATGNPDCLAFAAETADRALAQGDISNLGSALLTLLDATGREAYADAMHQHFAQPHAEMPAHTLPLYAAYEMRFHKMARIADVSARYAKLAAKPKTLEETGWYAVSLLDSIAEVNEQLYEHYRLLVDLFRQAVAELLSLGQRDDTVSALLSFALMKGARMGVLNAEKYLPMGKRLFDRLPESTEAAYLLAATEAYHDAAKEETP